jgi:hypothetical protein
MKGRIRKAVLLALAVALGAATGCIPHVSRYRYLSFEELQGVNVESVAPIEVENLVFGSVIPVEYSLVREGYTLRMSVDPRSYFPNATVELTDASDVRLVPRPSRGASANRPRPCGSYDEIAISGDSFVFSWVICGVDADPDELVVAFDVVGGNLGVREEALQFMLRSDGIYWLRDSL